MQLQLPPTVQLATPPPEAKQTGTYVAIKSTTWPLEEQVQVAVVERLPVASQPLLIGHGGRFTCGPYTSTRYVLHVRSRRGRPAASRSTTQTVGRTRRTSPASAV